MQKIKQVRDVRSGVIDICYWFRNERYRMRKVWWYIVFFSNSWIAYARLSSLSCAVTVSASFSLLSWPPRQGGGGRLARTFSLLWCLRAVQQIDIVEERIRHQQAPLQSIHLRLVTFPRSYVLRFDSLVKPQFAAGIDEERSCNLIDHVLPLRLFDIIILFRDKILKNLTLWGDFRYWCEYVI